MPCPWPGMVRLRHPGDAPGHVPIRRDSPGMFPTMFPIGFPILAGTPWDVPDSHPGPMPTPNAAAQDRSRPTPWSPPLRPVTGHRSARTPPRARRLLRLHHAVSCTPEFRRLSARRGRSAAAALPPWQRFSAWLGFEGGPICVGRWSQLVGGFEDGVWVESEASEGVGVSAFRP